jgi:Skp family chaperone for outer membrane proteins
MTIYGVEFVSEGQTMSIHDLFIENQCQYVARDIDPMNKDGDSLRKKLTAGTKLASDLGRESEAQDYKDQNDPFAQFTKFKNRNNPFF